MEVLQEFLQSLSLIFLGVPSVIPSDCLRKFVWSSTGEFPPKFGVSPGFLQSSFSNSSGILRSSTSNTSRVTPRIFLDFLRKILQSSSVNSQEFLLEFLRSSKRAPLEIPPEFLKKPLPSRNFFLPEILFYQKLLRSSSKNSPEVPPGITPKLFHQFFRIFSHNFSGFDPSIPR